MEIETALEACIYLTGYSWSSVFIKMTLLLGQRIENKVALKEMEETPAVCRKLGEERG